jgi:hypothetical protein
MRKGPGHRSGYRDIDFYARLVLPLGGRYPLDTDTRFHGCHV